MRTLRSVVAAASLSLAACTPHRAATAPPDGAAAASARDTSVAANRAAFQRLLAEEWDDAMARRPEMASILGDLRFNDRSSDLSAAAVAAELERDRRFLARFEAIDPAGFGDQEALTRTLIVKALREEIADARFEEWKMPVSQFRGLHIEAPQLASRFPFRTDRHYEDYATRLRALPRQLEETVANMRLGMEAGLMPPRYLLEMVSAQARRIAVNTSHFAKRTTIEQEATAHHEGVPGHHLQLALQAEIGDVPNQRKIPSPGSGAFVEGWALYAESLGKEIGRYQDPYSDYGRLQSEMWRAVRLVVDTGVHARRWTREQMVEFFRQHANVDDVDVQAEVDRYVAWPGQALAYKTGELEIRRLREKARESLGARFDLRRFHDAVLGAGALPLDVLGQRIDRWIAAERAR